MKKLIAISAVALLSACSSGPATWTVNGEKVVGSEVAAPVVMKQMNEALRSSKNPAWDEPPVFTALKLPEPIQYESGRVEVVVAVGADGAVRLERLVSAPGRKSLRAITNAVAEWKATPAKKAGAPIESLVTQAFNI